MFNPDEPRLAKGIVCELPYPTDDTRYITRAAIAGLTLIYRDGFAFSKAEVLLMDLCQRGRYTADLFSETQPAAAERVMGVVDAVNAKWGRNTPRPGRTPAAPDWGMWREMMSRSFTTRMDQLSEVGQEGSGEPAGQRARVKRTRARIVKPSERGGRCGPRQ